MASTGMIIDGVLGSECVDSSGEVLDVEGADISDLEEGRGVLNYEHKGAEDSESNGQEIVGKIVTAKKIFKEGDCDNGRQRAFWKKVKHPFIYGVCRLYDGAGHEGAKALAAQIRDHYANGEPILVRFSVEGSTLEKDGNVLKRSVIRRVALTLKPCNRTADSGLIEDPHAPAGFEKKPVSKVGDILAELADDAKKMEHQHPGYMKLGGAVDMEYSEFTPEDRTGLVKSLIKLKVMRKAMEEKKPAWIPEPGWHPATGGWPRYQGTELEQVPIERLFFIDSSDDHTNADGKGGAETVQELMNVMRAGRPLKPALGIEDQDGTIEVDDGNHRVSAAKQLGMTHVPMHVSRRVKKALDAGRGDAAPSQLTGGAALQREDIIRFKPKAMKVLKSYLDKSDGFDRAKLVQILKQELPEASDDFINHFAGVAEDYTVKLRKDAKDDPYPKVNHDIAATISVDDKPRVDRASEPAGALKPERKGGLEMKAGGKTMLPKGSKRVALQQHFPEDDLYKALLDPDEGLEKGVITPEDHAHLIKTIHDPWHRAMSHWLPLNAALKDGKVPKSIIAKSVIFAAMSPNTSVPNQERYYGHYMDMLHEGKVDPFRQMDEQALREFTARSSTTELPKWNREYFRERAGNVGSGVSDDPDKGELPQIQGLRNAHLLFPYLEHLTAKYKDDTQGIAAELMDMKHEHNKFKLATDIDKRQGRTHIERTPPAHPRILGFGPKLTRYLLGMYGGGNMIVPDRHMVRSTFDLHQDDDADMLEKLQTQVVTKAHNERFLRAIDHNFFVKHPAVRRVLETFPKHFAGREQQAIFPAFWLHWLTIGHYDRMRGRPSMAFNTDTDHGVFWDSVRDEMIKHGLHPHPLHDGRVLDGDADDSFDFGDMQKSEKGLDPWPRDPNFLDHPTWLKAAGAMEALRQRWGETPALLAFFSHIVPKLLKGDSPVAPVAHVPSPVYHPHMLKAEALMLGLKKAMADAMAGDSALAEIAPQIHHVYIYRVGPDLKIKRHAAGRYTTAGNHLHILEDYHGELGSHLTEGPITEAQMQQQANLRNSNKLDVASLHEINSGARPELWTPPAPQPARPASSFDFIRQGQERADHLEFIGGQAHLNGEPLNDEQTQALYQHVRNGHASVRYRNAGNPGKIEAVRKMELALLTIMKADPSDPNAAQAVHAALGKLDELVRAGHLEPHHAEALRNHAFKDPMTGNVMGNKFAYTDFKSRGDSRGGIHIVMDGNDFKSVNDKFGHEVGDSAIKAMGKAVRDAMDETVGQEHGKLFRMGGDEFAAHVPTHEHAAKFARTLRAKLEAIPGIQGTHKLSMGLGFGTSPEDADKALYEAKKQKYDPTGMIGNDSRKWVSKYAPGSAPSLAHSLVPGFEGPVPLDHSQLNIKPPPTPQPRPPAPEPVVHTPSVQQPQPSDVEQAVRRTGT